jgi:hypothetical protein
MKNYQPPSNTYWLVFAIIALILAAWRLYVYYRPSQAEQEKARHIEEKRARLLAGLKTEKQMPDKVKEAIEADKKAPTPVVREKPITGEWDIIINTKDKK